MSTFNPLSRESRSETSNGDATHDSPGHAALQQGSNPTAAADAQPGLQESLNRSPKVQAQLRIKQSLSQSPKAQSLTQAQRMLNQRPSVVAQAKLAAALNGHNGASQSQTLQRQELPEEEETTEQPRSVKEEELLQGKFEAEANEGAVAAVAQRAESRPGEAAGLTVQRKLSFQQLEAIHAIFTDARRALWGIHDALEMHKMTRAEAHERYMRLFERLEVVDTDDSEASENVRMELMERALDEAQTNSNAISQSAEQERAAPAETVAITQLARDGRMNAALLRTCDAFGLDECPVRATNDYANVVPPGTPIPPGTPFGVTVGGPRQPGNQPVVVYIHEDWIRRWLLASDQIGNLVDTIRHEQTHAKQKKDPNFVYDASEDVKEFEAYSAEVVTAQDRIANNAVDRMRPTEPTIRFAVQKARDHFRQMEPAQRNSYQAQLDMMNAIWTSLQPKLAASDDARNATAADIQGFILTTQELHRYRVDLDLLNVPATSPAYSDLSGKAHDAWKRAMSYYEGITINSRKDVAAEYQMMDNDHEEFLAYNRRNGPRPRPAIRVASSARGMESPASASASASSSNVFKIAPPPPSGNSRRSRARPSPQPTPSSVGSAAAASVTVAPSVTATPPEPILAPPAMSPASTPNVVANAEPDFADVDFGAFQSVSTSASQSTASGSKADDWNPFDS